MLKPIFYIFVIVLCACAGGYQQPEVTFQTTVDTVYLWQANPMDTTIIVGTMWTIDAHGDSLLQGSVQFRFD